MNCLKMANDENKTEKDTNKYSENDQWNDDLDVMPLNYVKPEGKKPIVEKAEFDKKKKRKWIPLLAMISILAGSSPLILNTCEGKDKVPNKIAVIVSDGNKKDSIIEEEYLENIEANIIEETEFIEDTVIIETIESNAFIEEQTTELGPRFFHIVIGSFEQENNALSFVQGLENQDSETKIIQHKGIYRVSFNSYFDSDEAEIELDYIRNTLNLKSWIAYMK
jgi:hypothetical protein